MSLFKGIDSSSSPSHDLDGSDGPTHHPKSQTQYAEEVVAHLEAARVALRQLSVVSVEVLCSDPGLDPVYVGCMREMIGLGCGLGGKEGVLPRSIPVVDRVDQHWTAAKFLDKCNIGQSSGSKSIPGYVFTTHFFPRGTYSRCARADRPTELLLTKKMMDAMKKNPSTAHITAPTTVSWTAHGDISIHVPPDAIGMEEFIQQIPLMKVLEEASSSSSTPQPEWGRCRERGSPSTFFLKLQCVPVSWIPQGNFMHISTFFPTSGSTPSPQEAYNTGYTLPQDFFVTGKTVSNGGGSGDEAMCDAFIELSGLEHCFVENMRRACRSNTTLKGRYRNTTRYFSTAFIELKDCQSIRSESHILLATT